MTDYITVFKGFAAYLENEFIPKLGGVTGWIAGGVVALALERAGKTYKALVTNPTISSLLKTLDVINEDGQQVDIDALYKAFSVQANKQPLVIETSIFGKITFTKDDLDQLYKTIKEV